MNDLRERYNPDILETIANLSNDEVFTPPKLAREILDLLPEEVWSDSSLKFLDPAVKTGIFLREITSRLIVGLEDEFPDLQERVNHILTNQIYGVGITKLTTLMSRRTVYCSKDANGKYSICTEFDDEEGNIRYPETKHTFDKSGRCEFCGANESNYDREGGLDDHAYSFIHDDFKEVFGDMKFDVIIGNPPYQLSDGVEGGNSFLSRSIYHEFVEKAIALEPKYISMIIPSRWMTGSARGIPSEWVDKTVEDNRIRIIHDFEDADSVFSGVEIAGGVNYFLWDYRNKKDTKYIFHRLDGSVHERNGLLDEFGIGSVVRDPKMSSIIKKVIEAHGNYYQNDDENFSGLVSPNSFFNKGSTLTTNWRDYKKSKSEVYNIKYYVSEKTNDIPYGWIKEAQVPRNRGSIDVRKIFIPAKYGNPIRYDSVVGVPRDGGERSVCSQTYVAIGYDKERHNFTSREIESIISYIETKFMRFLVRAKKTTQAAARGVYQFVPLQDWSKSWTDEELYNKYKLTDEEIQYIEEIIPPMGDDSDE